MSPSSNAKRAPIGTKYSAVASLCEQRIDGTYHQRMPWPDRDDERLQSALLGASSPRAEWAVALTCLFAVVCGMAAVWRYV